MGGTKKLTRDNQHKSAKVLKNEMLGTKVAYEVSKGFKPDFSDNLLLSSNLYSKIEELVLDEVIGGIKLKEPTPNIYVKFKSFVNASSTDVFASFVNYYLHLLAYKADANVVLVAFDELKNKNRIIAKRFVALAQKPRGPEGERSEEDDTAILIGLLFSDSRAKRYNHKALIRKTKNAAQGFLQRYSRELGLPNVKLAGPTLFVHVAAEFPENEIKIDVRDGHESIKITIPLRVPEWSLDDFPEELGEELRTLVIDPITNKMAFAPKGMLLVGPPGVGKTILVEAVAGGLGRKLLELEPGMYRSMWYGQTEKILKEIFNAVSKRKDEVVVLIDDAEFLMDRGLAVHEGYVSEMNVFLKLLQNRERPLIAMTTNHPQLLDQALVRPGRVDLAVIVGYPDKEFRRKIVERAAKRYELKMDEHLIEKVVRVTRWFSNAEIDSLIRMAAAKGKGKITEESVEWARRRFHIDEGERERLQESLRWYANKLQGMVVSYVKNPWEV
ncbi:ATP-binding protein [Ignicoccus hospitalis]|uniref:ATP-binding protein n=1 Tax=Ignicoccus hospitalis TaxID=160233 RepID=UPI000695DC88|nr:AAA family ATPase [Ignicoccus hospitalis]HIH91072.1 AAA family ATPase [Desulfurococcaceae archaeon]